MSQFGSFFGTNAALGTQLIWEHTIYQVVRLFEEAERRIRSSEGQQYYTDLEGWWRQSRHRINGKNGYKVPEETAVSQALVEQMELAKRDFMLGSRNGDPDIGDIDSLEFHAEAPRRQKTGIGRRAKPTDFRFYRRGIGAFDLRIEAKVIVKDAEISKQYLSSEGLGRFSDPNEPYTDELVGGMISYTVSEDRAAWLERIENKMAASDPTIPSFRHALPPTGLSVLFCRVPFKFEKMQTHSEILVFHVVLQFDCSPSAR